MKFSCILMALMCSTSEAVSKHRHHHAKHYKDYGLIQIMKDQEDNAFLDQGELESETQNFKSKTKHYEYPEIPVARTSEEYSMLYKRA